jgi:hypothetical protein
MQLVAIVLVMTKRQALRAVMIRVLTYFRTPEFVVIDHYHLLLLRR